MPATARHGKSWRLPLDPPVRADRQVTLGTWVHLGIWAPWTIVPADWRKLLFRVLRFNGAFNRDIAAKHYYLNRIIYYFTVSQFSITHLVPKTHKAKINLHTLRVRAAHAWTSLTLPVQHVYLDTILVQSWCWRYSLVRFECGYEKAKYLHTCDWLLYLRVLCLYRNRAEKTDLC